MAPRCPCSPFLPPGPGAAELQVAGRCHGGRASSAAAPESQWERSVRHPLTSDLCDPNLSIWGLSRKFRQAGRLHSTRAGRCPWGTAREHRCQVCELPGWRRQQGDGHRLPRRGEPGGLHGRRDRAGRPGCEGRRGCPVRKRLKSQGEARVATACLDRACPSWDTEGGWGLSSPRGRSRDSPVGQARCPSLPSGNLLWATHISVKTEHPEAACPAVPAQPGLLGVFASPFPPLGRCVHFRHPDARGLLPFATHRAVPSQEVCSALPQQLLTSAPSGRPMAVLIGPGSRTPGLQEAQLGAGIPAHLGSDPRCAGWVRGRAQLTESGCR